MIYLLTRDADQRAVGLYAPVAHVEYVNGSSLVSDCPVTYHIPWMISALNSRSRGHLQATARFSTSAEACTCLQGLHSKANLDSNTDLVVDAIVKSSSVRQMQGHTVNGSSSIYVRGCR